MSKTVFFVLYLIAFITLLVMNMLSSTDYGTMILLAAVAILSKADYNKEE